MVPECKQFTIVSAAPGCANNCIARENLRWTKSEVKGATLKRLKLLAESGLSSVKESNIDDGGSNCVGMCNVGKDSNLATLKAETQKFVQVQLVDGKSVSSFIELCKNREVSG